MRMGAVVESQRRNRIGGPDVGDRPADTGVDEVQYLADAFDYWGEGAAALARSRGKPRPGQAEVDTALAEVLAEEGEDLCPTVHGLLRPVGRPIVVEEAVPGTIIALKHVGLSVLLQRLLMLIDVRRTRRLVLIPKEAQQRRVEARGVVDRRDRLLGRE